MLYNKIQYNIIKKYKILHGIFFLLFILPISHANIVTSIRPLAFIATAIADGVTNVSVLIPNNISPHHYSLKPSDLNKIKKSKLFIWIGGDIEFFLKKTINSLTLNKQIELISHPDIINLLIRKKIHKNTKLPNISNNNFDAHIWLSPKIAKIIAKLIHDKLILIYSNHKKILDKNLLIFNNQLNDCDIYIYKLTQSFIHKPYYVFHDAYSYFENHYHLSSLGTFTNNHFIYPSAKKLYKIKKTITQIKEICIFIEKEYKPILIKKIIQNTHTNIGILDPLGNNIPLTINSYVKFLISLSNAFNKCLSKQKKCNINMKKY